MPLKTSREVLKKLQPKLRMIADGDADVNIVRAERTAALIVESPASLKKVEQCRGADAVPIGAREPREKAPRPPAEACHGGGPHQCVCLFARPAR